MVFTFQQKVLSQSKVVLLMKGHPDEPKCGFSRQIVGIMKQTGVEYTHFDIFTDQKFRYSFVDFLFNSNKL